MHHRRQYPFTIGFMSGLLVSTTMLVRADSPIPEPQARISLGIQFGVAESCHRPISTLRPTGVCVLGTRPNGAAEHAGIMAGDILQKLGDTSVNTANDLLGAVRLLNIGDRPQVVISRQDAQLSLNLEIRAQDRVTASANQAAIALPQPPALPYRILPPPADAKTLLSKVDDVDTAVWLEADVLNVVHRDSREGVRVGGTLQLPMLRIPEEDVWTLQLEMKGWDRSFFSYTFVAPGAIDGPPPTVRHFHGSNATALPVILENLRGKVFERTLRSRFLQEDRQISVYIPPAANRRDLHVLFMADGQATADFARVIEPLIVSGRVAPVAIVGIHARPSQFAIAEAFDVSRDRRSQEYLIGVAPETYAKHMKFFIEEVVPWASLEFGLSYAREDRAVFGFSSGAAFAAAAALQHPDIFAHALPFSIGVPELPAKPTGVLPRFHLVAGELEPDFLASTRIVRNVVAAWGADATLSIYMSGHDRLMWQLGLAQLIPRVFPA